MPGGGERETEDDAPTKFHQNLRSLFGSKPDFCVNYTCKFKPKLIKYAFQRMNKTHSVVKCIKLARHSVQ